MYDNNRWGSRWWSRGWFWWGSRWWDRGWRSNFGRRDERPEFFEVVCDECGDDCQVPFKPTWDKPVLCSECFGRSKSRGWDFDRNDRWNRGRGRDDRRWWRDSFWEKKMYSAVCDQCGDDCELPFKPSSDKPVFCSKCFEDVEKSRPKKWEEYKADFAKLEEKLDMIIKFLWISNEPKEKVVHKLPKKEKEEIIEEVAELEEKVTKKKATAKKAK